MNIVAKTQLFYTQHGLWRTVVRITERLTNLQLLPPNSPLPRSAGRATTILNASYGRQERRVAHVTPGMAVAQELGILFDEIFEIELHLEMASRFQATTVVLVGEQGQEVFKERVDPRRLANGTYCILFDKPLSASAAGRLHLLICNSGKRGDLTVRLASDFDGQLPAATLRPVQRADDPTYVNGEERARAPIALRVAGRSSSEHATYHRLPVPPAWRATHIEIGTVYAAGLGGPAKLPTARRLAVKEASVDALRLEPPGTEATSVLVLGTRTEAQQGRELVAAAKRRFLPVVAVLLGEAPAQRSETHGRYLNATQLANWADLVLVRSHEDALRFNKPEHSVRVCAAGIGEWMSAVRNWLPTFRRQILPRFSIVTILYNKAAPLPAVLLSYFRQTYQGDFEVVFVDDASPDDSVAVVEQTFAKARQSGLYPQLPSYKIVRNARNAGNCVSRNIGLAHADGDIVVIIDADCMLNRDFLTRHAQAHSFGDTDVVIGPLNIETENEEPIPCLDALELNPAQAARRTQLQDEANRTSFVNCITRNFSIRKELVEAEFFDPAFSYTADPTSGYGWEDVEMGYRLYKRGLRIKYVSDAFSLHITHDSPVLDKLKPARSVKNFRRLLEKHPDLRHEARQWVRQTTTSLRQWFEAVEAEPSDDLKTVEAMLPAVPDVGRITRKSGRQPGKLNVLTYRWHVPHQYELYKLGHEFSLVRDLDTAMTGSWELGQRPLPDNARFISKSSIREMDFDLAILHFDENVLDWQNCNGVIGPDWGAAFRWFMENVRIPKVAICHGTPQFYGQYNIEYDKPDLLHVIESAREKLVDYLGDTLVICNSHQAQSEWGFRRSRVIWHGFDPTEFPPATYERGILSPLGPLVLSRPHYRGYFVYKKVFADFPRQFAPSTLLVPDPCPLYQGNQFARWKYRNYVDEVRRYSIYFNPTLRSPMPRARGEPMMCGVATVCAKNHDVDMFVENGVNGFYADDPEELRDQLLFLSRNPDAARKVGQAGRRTAIDVFNIERYLSDWRAVINAVV